MSTEISVQGYAVPAAIANRFDRNSHEKSPFSYSKPTPGEPTRHTKIPIPRVLNYASEEEDPYFPPPPHPQSERAMPQIAHLQYNSPADLYSRESAQEQFVQQIGDGSIPLPAPLPEKHFDPNRSATLRYIKEGDRNGYGPSLEQQIAAAEQPREYKSPEPTWANYAREKSERARSMTPGYHRAQSEPRDTWTYEYQRESSKTPARDIDWREFQERTKTYVHDTKGGGVPYWAHAEFNQPNQTHHEYREKTPKGYECGGIDYRGNLHFDPPGPYDYVYTTKKKEEKQSRPGFAIGGTDFGTGYVSAGPYHGHGPDPPRRRTKYTADPNAPVNVALAPNIDAVDPHLLIGDTVSNMKTGKEKGSKEDGWMGLSYRSTEGFKRDHRATARHAEQKQDNTFCTNYTRRSRSASAPRSSAPPEQRNVWRNNQENYDPYYHGADKTVNIHTLLTDEALVPRKRETTPTWREKSLEKHYKWEHREDPAHVRPMTWTREPNWTRTVQERRGAWENRAWDTEARLALPASAKVRSEPPPSWQQNAQQKQSIWQSAANQQNGTNSYTYSIPPGNQYTYQTTTTTTGPPPHQSQIAAQNYQTSYSSNYGDNNANYVANTGFNQKQYDYLEERREKYGPGGHGGTGDGYQQQQQQQQYTTNTQATNTTQNQPQMQSYQAYNQQQQHQEQRETRKTTTNVQNTPVTRTTTYSYSQQPTSQPIALQNGAFQTSHSSTTHTVRENSQPAAPVQSYQQQQQYYQERREKTTSEERTTQPVQQIQQQWQQQNQEQRNEQKTIREERVKPAQWWEQQQQQRRETKTTREEVTRPQQVQQQWHEQRHHRREETRTENVQPSQPIQQQSWQQQQSRREEKTTKEESQPVQLQQQYWQQQQQSRREEKTTKEESQPVQPIIQQQHWQQQQSRREEKTTKEESQPIQLQQQYWQQQQSRREEKTTKEESQPIQPIIQQQHWQQQSRKEEKTTREETRPAQPLVQQWQSQQNYQKKTENRTENKQSYPLVSSNSGTKTTVVSGPPVDRKLEMSEKLPLGAIANTHANTQGSYHNQQGHEISYKRDLQTTADPGRDVALLKEEERRVVENELEPGVISRHITTKYYKKKTVTDTTTTNQQPSYEIFQAGRTILGPNPNQNRRQISKSAPNVHEETNFENYERTVDFLPHNFASLPQSAQNEFNQWTASRFAEELSNPENFSIASNYAQKEYETYNASPRPMESIGSMRNTPRSIKNHNYFQKTLQTIQSQQQQQQQQHFSAPMITSELAAIETYAPSPINPQFLLIEQTRLPLNDFDLNHAQEYHGETSTDPRRTKSSTPSKRSKSEPRSMNGSFIDESNRELGSTGKVVSIPTLLDGSALVAKRYKVVPFWYEKSLSRHHSWKNIRDPYVPPRTGADKHKPYWADRDHLKKGVWELQMKNHNQKVVQLTADHYGGDPLPVHVYSNNKYTSHGMWPTVASHVAAFRSQPNLHYDQRQEEIEERNEDIGVQQWKHETRRERTRSRSSSEKPVSAVQPIQGNSTTQNDPVTDFSTRSTVILPHQDSRDSQVSQATVIENPQFVASSSTITQSQFL